MANHLSYSKKILILTLLTEGNSIRSIERITQTHRDTIMRLLVSAGNRAQDILDEKLRNLKCKDVQVDEIWTYVGKKQKQVKSQKDKRLGYGDQYIFVALDSDTKLVPCFYIGRRNYNSTLTFLYDLNERIDCRFQLSTDAYPPYKNVVEEIWGCEIDYAQIHKHYGEEVKAEKRYSPARIIRVSKKEIMGYPDEGNVSTSYVERQNLTMRMNMRRLTRLTNAFSKKLENLKASISLHYFHYNFMRVHQTTGTTPAIASGVANYIWSWEDFLGTYNIKTKVA